MDALDQLARIEAKLDRVLNGPESPTVTVSEAMRMFHIKGRTSFYRLADQLNIKPFAHGKYRRNDILNAMARTANANARAARLSAESELRTEAQRRIARVNPDND